MAQQISLKQLAINKDNTAILVVISLAAFITVFSLVASNALLKQRAYQAKVIKKRSDALKVLKTDVSEIQKLQTSYIAFANADQNVLGGSAKGNGEKDGENPRIVLDALPSKYDFPALTTSLQKMFSPYKIETISGNDDEVAQSAVAASASPQQVEMPITMAISGSTESLRPMLQTFERSIRPIQINKLTISGQTNKIRINVDAKTYFQPQKKFDIKSENVTK